MSTRHKNIKLFLREEDLLGTRPYRRKGCQLYLTENIQDVTRYSSSLIIKKLFVQPSPNDSSRNTNPKVQILFS